jgi:hypothetical protein
MLLADTTASTLRRIQALERAPQEHSTEKNE